MTYRNKINPKKPDARQKIFSQSVVIRIAAPDDIILRARTEIASFERVHIRSVCLPICRSMVSIKSI